MSISRRSFLKNSGLTASALGVSSVLGGCSSFGRTTENNTVAVLADVHFHDVYGEYGFRNECPTDEFGRQVTMRSMNVSCRSTRMFNENYFVLKATLDDLGARGVKYICFSGDYSDDGQFHTLQGFKRVLNQYKDKYGFEYFLTPGNHDCFPHNKEFAKMFLASNGQQLKIYSADSKHDGTDEGQHGHKMALYDDMRGCSPEQSMDILADFGFRKQDHWLHYETPFGQSDATKDRYYQVHNAKNGADYLEDRFVDASYLVEPEDGLWLCMVDMNSYYPDKVGVSKEHKGAWGDCVANKFGKGYLVEWLESVSERAEQQGKKLLFISHYPLLNFLDGDGIANPDYDPLTYDGHDFNYLLGDKSNTVARLPAENTGKVMLEKGMKLHFAGHMHVNDTYQMRTSEGHLTNIQVPSLSAYIPAYKLVEFKSQRLVEINTIVVNDVPDFDALFPFYRTEVDYLRQNGRPTNDSGAIEAFDPFWEEMLQAANYRDLMRLHLMTLVRNRFFDSMTADVKALFTSNPSLYALMVASQLDDDSQIERALSKAATLTVNSTRYECVSAFNGDSKAVAKVEAHIKASQLKRAHFFNERFEQLLDLTYHLKNADELSLEDFGFERIPVYQTAMEQIQTLSIPQLAPMCSAEDFACQTEVLQARLAAMGRVFELFARAHPATHFSLDLKTGEINDLWGKNPWRV
ncbi:metallophosphoesterase [Vibrio scophthalmi]|uniref:metallophosphoesterase n=1 Tax=Vibrio scophthalmi TaxID=45658 RepID=UPI00228498BE|nr:metallophosphoesterase [Vibrio scophthalmi]MCY9804575.1 metallophosphoesterase [Vibrio scophthalmi]